MRTVLVTGGAGFIGSNFIPFYIKNNPTSKIVNLNVLTYAGTLKNLTEIENNPRYTFVEGDICVGETTRLDAGTFSSLKEASQFLQVIEEDQGLKIGAIEVAAY